MVIFDSDNNFSQHLVLKFKDTIIRTQNLFINKILDEYIEIDFSVDNVLEIAEMENIIADKVNSVNVYPDFTNEDIFFEMQIYKCISFKSVFTYYKIYCKPTCTFHKGGKTINDFNENFSDFSKAFILEDNEIAKIKDYTQRQYQSHWFNDQNIFVENEYKRVLKLVNKKPQGESNKVFDPSILKTSMGPSDPFSELNRCVGLDKVKHEVKRLNAMLEYKKNNNTQFSESLHMCFYGNPGTGKTTIARIMAGILYNLGYIKLNKCVEINGLELKGSNVGQTSLITKGVIDYAKGGVLFIDEAYTLFDKTKNNFGIEAINLLLKEMEDNRENLVVILAGYYGPMQELLDSNVGFRSRVKHYFEFEDYSTTDLFEIFMNLIRNRHLYVDEKAMKKIMLDFKNARVKKSFGNGRYVENFLLKTEEEHILNVAKNISETDIITENDIVEGIDIFDV